MANILFIAGLVLYAIVHSLMASKQFKRAVKHRFGERAYDGLYRIVYNIIAIVLVIPVLLFIWLRGTPVYTVPQSLWPLFDLLQIIGLLGIFISLIQINLGHFLGISQAVAYFRGESLPLPQEKLSIHGIYTLIRHPLYLFSMLAIWPIYPMTDLLLIFNIAVTIYFVVGARLEEKRLLEAFGEEYALYQRRVPAFLPIPRPHNSGNDTSPVIKS